MTFLIRESRTCCKFQANPYTSGVRVWDIYIATSPSGKKYIGQTKVGTAKRWKRHHANELCYALAAAIRKYGKNSFSVEHVATCTSQDNADLVECALIAEYRSTDSQFGYNITLGGRGHSLEYCWSRRHKLADVGRRGTACAACNDEYRKEWVVRQTETWHQRRRERQKTLKKKQYAERKATDLIAYAVYRQKANEQQNARKLDPAKKERDLQLIRFAQKRRAAARDADPVKRAHYLSERKRYRAEAKIKKACVDGH